MRDSISDLEPKQCISPQSTSTDTPVVSSIIDRKGAEQLAFIILTGSIADADVTFAVLLEHGDDPALSDAAAVPDSDMVGATPEVSAGFQFDDDDSVRKLGYVGNKRYTRLTITPTGNASAALLAAVAIRQQLHLGPAPAVPV